MMRAASVSSKTRMLESHTILLVASREQERKQSWASMACWSRHDSWHDGFCWRVVCSQKEKKRRKILTSSLLQSEIRKLTNNLQIAVYKQWQYLKSAVTREKAYCSPSYKNEVPYIQTHCRNLTVYMELKQTGFFFMISDKFAHN